MSCKAKARNGGACKARPIPGTAYCRWHQPDQHQRPTTGVAFEERVKKTLRLLGYRAERNVTSFGSQIDLYAEIRIGVLHVRLMVECKDYGERLVGIEEINKFAGVLAVARNMGAVDKGLLITTTGFTRDAKTNAAKAGIELTTFAELSTQLVDFTDFLNRTIKNYQDLPASSRYIDLAGTETEEYIEVDRASFIRPIDTYINRFLLEEGPGAGKQLALLGNFGTGKSTFCRKYAHDLALAYQADPSRRIPILINLTDYDWRFDIQHLILQSLTARYEIAISNAVCQELQRQGRFLIILDGLDEMATRVDIDTIEDNIREIAKLTLIDNNRILLTCRTHFFRDKIEVQLLRDFAVLFIPEWGAEELQVYLQKSFGAAWKEKLKLISDTHNLTELAQTPLFLEMIVESLPELGDAIARTRLYQVYTDKWIVEQSRRKGARLREEARRQFVKELAVGLWLEDKHARHYQDFGDLLRSKFQLDDAAQVDYLRSDVQTCTFLTRDSEGNYGFRHRSFMEYFVAYAISETIEHGAPHLLSHKLLTVEVRGFVADLLDRTKVADILREWIKGGDDILRQNALALASVIGVPLSEELFGEIQQSAGDVQLASNLVRGDIRAFEQLYATYADSVHRYLTRISNSSVEADDCMADVFLRVWRHGGELERIENLRGWIFTVARRVYLDRRRTERRRTEKYVELDFDRIVAWEPVAPAEDDYLAKINAIDVDKLLLKLPDSEREVVRRYVFERESLTKIAKDMNLSTVVVRRMYSRAIEKLRRVISADSAD
jgi:RNA polymerase sigma factor (sigma-70 family)